MHIRSQVLFFTYVNLAAELEVNHVITEMVVNHVNTEMIVNHVITKMIVNSVKFYGNGC